MTDDAPMVTPWSQRLSLSEAPPRLSQGPRQFATLRDYIDDRARNTGPQFPEVQLGYANLKRRG